MSVWITSIASVILVSWLLYWLLFAPFGPSSRCQLSQIIKSDKKILAKLMIVDESMIMPMIRAHLAEHGHRVATYEELEVILNDPYIRKLLPEDARILGERTLADEKHELWAIDTSTKCFADRVASRFHKIEPPTSLEHCFIAAVPCT